MADAIAMVADVIATFFVADVTTTVSDVVATRYICVGWSYCHGVRCYNHPGWMGFFWQMLKPIVVDVITTGQLFTLGLVLRCLTEPHPKCVADGICQYFYLGMDY